MSVSALLGATAACASREPVWSYAGASGPAAWARLDPGYGTCASGRSQSPVDIVEVLPRDLPNLDLRYGRTPVKLRNTGRGLEQDVVPGSQLMMGSVAYTLTQLRFHAPSEHRAAGTTFAMELQWVHRSPQGHLAIMAVMVKLGKANAALEPLLGRLPASAGDQVEGPLTLALGNLLPAQRTYMRYSGSLTQPPCWENVIWMILTEPIEASAAQIAAFTKVHGGNVRPVMPVGRRAVFFDATP